jgi:amidase
MTQWMLSHAAGRKPYTPGECFKLNAEREAFRTQVVAQWNATRLKTNSGRLVDCILTPVFPSLAPAHGTTRWWGYSSYWWVWDHSHA